MDEREPETISYPAEAAGSASASAQPIRSVDELAGADPRPPGGYALRQRRLHWLVAAFVAVQLAVGLWIRANGASHHAGVLALHAAVGTAIFFLVLQRFRVRQQLGAPEPPEGTPTEVAKLAQVNHLGYYVILLALPVFGWLAYLCQDKMREFFGGFHWAFAVTLMLAICAHLAGVIYHTYVRHDGLLRRMWPIRQ
jgi:cytochrome b561